MQLNIFSLMYIIRVYVRRVKHTWVLARSTSGTVSVRTAE